MFNFRKKVNSEELDHHRRCAIGRFSDGKYQETIDNCNLVLKFSANDDLALEFKFRALLMLGNDNDFDETTKVLNKLREVAPNNSAILKYDETKKMLGIKI